MTLDLQAARELADRATPGPWEAHARPVSGSTVVDANGYWVAHCDEDPGSATFIAASRTLVPQLIDELTLSRATADSLQRHVLRLTKEKQELQAKLNAAAEIVATSTVIRRRHAPVFVGVGEATDTGRWVTAVDAFHGESTTTALSSLAAAALAEVEGK